MSEKSEEEGKMSRQEAGIRGGEKVARERGSEFYRRIGRKGGEKVAEERCSEFFKKIGRKGGESRGNKISATPIKGAIDRKPKISNQR
jgi:general stress protein YciG